jgi:hypothetical protein
MTTFLQSVDVFHSRWPRVKKLSFWVNNKDFTLLQTKTCFKKRRGLGAFNNYVDRILPLFDPPPTPCVDSFCTLSVDKKMLFSSKLSHVTHSQHKNSKHMVSGDLKPPLGMTFQFFSWIQSGKLQLSISLRTFVKDIALNPLSKFSSLLIPLQSLPKPCATVYRLGQLALGAFCLLCWTAQMCV